MSRGWTYLAFLFCVIIIVGSIQVESGSEKKTVKIQFLSKEYVPITDLTEEWSYDNSKDVWIMDTTSKSQTQFRDYVQSKQEEGSEDGDYRQIRIQDSKTERWHSDSNLEDKINEIYKKFGGTLKQPESITPKQEENKNPGSQSVLYTFKKTGTRITVKPNTGENLILVPGEQENEWTLLDKSEKIVRNFKDEIDLYSYLRLNKNDQYSLASKMNKARIEYNTKKAAISMIGTVTLSSNTGESTTPNVGETNIAQTSEDDPLGSHTIKAGDKEINIPNGLIDTIKKEVNIKEPAKESNLKIDNDGFVYDYKGKTYLWKHNEDGSWTKHTAIIQNNLVTKYGDEIMKTEVRGNYRINSKPGEEVVQFKDLKNNFEYQVSADKIGSIDFDKVKELVIIKDNNYLSEMKITLKDGTRYIKDVHSNTDTYYSDTKWKKPYMKAFSTLSGEKVEVTINNDGDYDKVRIGNTEYDWDDFEFEGESSRTRFDQLREFLQSTTMDATSLSITMSDIADRGVINLIGKDKNSISYKKNGKTYSIEYKEQDESNAAVLTMMQEGRVISRQARSDGFIDGVDVKLSKNDNVNYEDGRIEVFNEDNEVVLIQVGKKIFIKDGTTVQRDLVLRKEGIEIIDCTNNPDGAGCNEIDAIAFSNKYRLPRSWSGSVGRAVFGFAFEAEKYINSVHQGAYIGQLLWEWRHGRTGGTWKTMYEGIQGFKIGSYKRAQKHCTDPMRAPQQFPASATTGGIADFQQINIRYQDNNGQLVPSATVSGTRSKIAFIDENGDENVTYFYRFSYKVTAINEEVHFKVKLKGKGRTVNLYTNDYTFDLNPGETKAVTARDSEAKYSDTEYTWICIEFTMGGEAVLDAFLDDQREDQLCAPIVNPQKGQESINMDTSGPGYGSSSWYYRPKEQNPEVEDEEEEDPDYVAPVVADW